MLLEHSVEFSENCQFSSRAAPTPLTSPAIPCLLRISGWTDLLRGEVKVIEPPADEFIWPNDLIEISEIVKVFADRCVVSELPHSRLTPELSRPAKQVRLE